MTRRGVVAGLALAGLAAAGGALWRFTDLFVKHYPPTPYDDVLAAVIDRAPAAKLGAVVLRGMPDFQAAAAAAKLRPLLAADGLAAAAAADAAQGRMIEAEGWLLPQSLALIAALTAKVSPPE